ncbi:hypothetical protein V1478_014341, partial [Vespula squamosa]
VGKERKNMEENMRDTYTPNVSVDRGESSSSVTATSVAWKDGDRPSAKVKKADGREKSNIRGTCSTPTSCGEERKKIEREEKKISEDEEEEEEEEKEEKEEREEREEDFSTLKMERDRDLVNVGGSSNDDDDDDNDDDDDEDQDATMVVAAVMAAAISKRRALTYGHEFTSFVRLSTLFYIFSCKRTEHS